MALASALPAIGDPGLEVRSMVTNGRTNPLGIPAEDLSFGWSIGSDAKGVTQSSYQIRVGTSEGGADVWDSGAVRSDRQVDVRLPERIRLAPAGRCFWQVKVWDGGGAESGWSEPAWFETGLLSEGDWRGAGWISRPVTTPEPWTDCRLAVEFSLENEALGVFLRASADPAEREATGAKFLEKLAADHHHLRTGFLGTPWLLPALSEIGRDDLAMRILLNEDDPSWGFPISLGATTMWERWNSVQPDGSFGPVDMNSFNHYAYGAVGDWMFAKIAGLRIVEPGFLKSRIAPLIGGGGLTHAKGSLDTPYGRLSSDWTVTGDRYVLRVTVPPNTRAEVVLPTTDPRSVTAGGKPVASAGGIGAVNQRDGFVVLEIGSGTYGFSAEGGCPGVR